MRDRGSQVPTWNPVEENQAPPDEADPLDQEAVDALSKKLVATSREWNRLNREFVAGREFAMGVCDGDEPGDACVHLGGELITIILAMWCSTIALLRKLNGLVLCSVIRMAWPVGSLILERPCGMTIYTYFVAPLRPR